MATLEKNLILRLPDGMACREDLMGQSESMVMDNMNMLFPSSL